MATPHGPTPPGRSTASPGASPRARKSRGADPQRLAPAPLAAPASARSDPRMPRPPPPADQRPIDRLLAIMARLRDPADGCPWDLEQTFATVGPHTVEEAYEVADAVERGDLTDLRDELGDLLLQVVFHARMAEEQGAFDFDAVATAINDK